MELENLIFTFSGIRGIIGEQLNFDIAKKISIAFGQWFKHQNRKIIIGRDTRPSGKKLEQGIIEGLVSTDFEVINVGISPTPLIIHAKNTRKIPAGIIITGSHNSEEWNGLKLLDQHNYLQTEDLIQIQHRMHNIKLKQYKIKNSQIKNKVTSFDPLPNYMKALKKLVNFQNIRFDNHLKVVVDSGAGAGKYVTPYILKELGCEVISINSEFLVKDKFPRKIEPIPTNLHDLIMEVWQEKYDIGFAHDSDADRLALVGENGVCYSEDTSLALIFERFLQNGNSDNENVIFVTNIASSLMFDVIAEKYDAQVIRTPIGELFLINKINEMTQLAEKDTKKYVIFGGEGSCGGVIFPLFNKTRDGIFAAVKIVEILVKTGEKLSQLVSKLPKFYSYREIIRIEGINDQNLIEEIMITLKEEGEEVVRIGNDIRFGKDKDWFVLIHPSNTEPIVRVIAEATSDSLSRLYCETTAELIKLILSNN